MKKYFLQNTLCIAFFLLVNLQFTFSQYPAGTILTEAQVPKYSMPDPFQTASGQLIHTFQQWETIQRPAIYRLFEDNVYGRMPDKSILMKAVVREQGSPAFDNLAVRRQVRIFLYPPDSAVYIDLLMYIPVAVQNHAPVFLGYNFGGNQSIVNDTSIFITNKSKYPVSVEKVPERGSDATSWPVKEILTAGFGIVTAYYGDIEPDCAEGIQNSIRTSLHEILAIEPLEWGAIGAWAWGLSRILDYLETDPFVNAKKVALIGHSRLGKVALWAGASDSRFAMVISNESGEAGAALSKREFGETIKNITDQFPYWFVPAYKSFSGNSEALPVDQHMLLGLIAPRPLYVASAEGDLWSDPHGEFLSLLNAERVYNLYHLTGLNTYFIPKANHPVGGIIRYHIRTGGHGINSYDWQQYIKFASEFLKIN
jgi:hypothetical protein